MTLEEAIKRYTALIEPHAGTKVPQRVADQVRVLCRSYEFELLEDPNVDRADIGAKVDELFEAMIAVSDRLGQP